MQEIKSLDDLNLPEKFHRFLTIFLNNISGIKSVKEVILFGSCARGDIKVTSDIDILVLGEHITEHEEDQIYIFCPPAYGTPSYLPCDIIVSNRATYDKYRDEPGMVQRWIELEGANLSELSTTTRQSFCRQIEKHMIQWF